MVKLHKVVRKLELDLDGEIIAVDVYKLDVPLATKLAEKQKQISESSKDYEELAASDISEIEKGIRVNEILAKMHGIYIEMFKLAVVDYSVIEKTINDIPYPAINIIIEIFNELNYEMTKTENKSIEKKKLSVITSNLLDEYKLRGYGHTTSEIKSFNFYEKWSRLRVIEAIEIQDDILRKSQLLYAIDYNKDLIKQLNDKQKEYEEFIGIEIKRDEQAFWNHVNEERQRFLRFIGMG